MSKKRFNKIYIEISNICNLSCSFCPGTRRSPEMMDLDHFECILDSVRDYTDYVYYHVMGEPMLHPLLGDFLDAAEKRDLKSCITTNGSLLKEKGRILLNAYKGIHKVSISLQAQEVNSDKLFLEDYVNECCRFAKLAERKFIVAFRLWNEGGQNRNNDRILQIIRSYFGGEWKQHPHGTVIGNRIYIEQDSIFEWPDSDSFEISSDRYFCYGLKDHIAVMVDGTVSCCCLDHDAQLSLGNIFEQKLEHILAGDRAVSIYEGFKRGMAAEELCRKCGYARRFTNNT